MNLNVSVQDLRLGRYESQKDILFRELVQRRAILNDPNEEEAPLEFIRSELLEFMLHSCRKTGVIVVQADRGVGKSTAAKFLIKNSAGGIMFCNCQSTSTRHYWQGVAQAVGIPAEVYEKDSTWETLLVKAVAAAKRPDDANRPPSSWTDRLMDGILSMCSGIETPEYDESDAPKIEGLSLSPLSPLKSGKRAIIVFDDFNNVQNDDILFMKHLFPIVKGQGVLAFVLVSDEDTANRLLALNGWGRISPLEGICDDASDAGGKEKIPRWKPPVWTKIQLETLVRSRFGDVDMGMIALEKFGNPLDVLDRARNLYDSDKIQQH